MSTANLHIEKKKMLAAKLRFTEFEGEWENRAMRDFTKINQGLQIPISERFYEKADDNYFYITNEFLRKGSEKSYFIKNPSESVICNEDDILMTRTGNTGQVVTGVHGAFHNNFFKIKYDKTCDKWFLYYFLTSHKTQHTILKLAGTSTIPDLNHGDFYKITLNSPSVSEQQKIASFLSAVDKKIQQLSRKKELLEQYKKGVMQQLFSGKLRFKDENGKVYPDWEEKKLGDVASRVTRKNKENNLNVLTISAQLGLVSQLEYFNKSVSAKDVTNYYLLERNDFAYNKSYSNGYPMGAIKRLKKYDKGVVSTLYICFCFNEMVSLNFMEQYFEFGLHNKEIEKVAQEGARNHGLLNIGVNDFLNIDLVMPSIEEQQKIAHFLSGIDGKIEQVNGELVKTQEFKKGLLQQLFV
ncbi:restriction endonuclease subunit S [Flavobacterium sp. XS2P14]|uniref:restriction endonuclease subunit S n=1 Tax=Flavobacterium sp. XS2P14 TaxID=3401735 RepID=UPI003AAF1033